MGSGRTDHRPHYPDAMREAIFRKALSGMGLPEIKQFWVNVLDPEGAYEEPVDRTFERWMRGEHLPKGARERVIFGVLEDRHEIQPEIIRSMAEAWASWVHATRAKRYSFWKELRVELREAQRTEGWPLLGDSDNVVLYSTLIVGAKTVADFPNRILDLYKLHRGREGVEFRYELEKLVGLDKESRDAEVAQRDIKLPAETVGHPAGRKPRGWSPSLTAAQWAGVTGLRPF